MIDTDTITALMGDAAARQTFVQIVVDRFYCSIDQLEAEENESAQWLLEAFEKPDVQDFLSRVFACDFKEFIDETADELQEWYQDHIADGEEV